MSAPNTSFISAWQRDLERFLPLKSQFIISGNVRDQHLCEINNTLVAQNIRQTLCGMLTGAGYAGVLVWEPVSGYSVLSGESDGILSSLGIENPSVTSLDMLGLTIEKFTKLSCKPCAFIIDFASRISVRADMLSSREHNLFTNALIMSHSSRAMPEKTSRKPFFNTIIWIAEKESDIPDLLTFNNPKIRHISIPKPDNAARRAFAQSLLKGICPQKDESLFKKVEDDFVGSTEGLLLYDMRAIATLAKVEDIEFKDISKAVRHYKTGVKDDPWRKIDKDKIRGGALYSA